MTNPDSEQFDPASCSSVIEALYISPGHNYFGRHGKSAGTHPIVPVDEIYCVAGRGIEGDRFCDFKDDYKGQITFFSKEVYSDLCKILGVHDKDYSVFRRNVITSGEDLDALIGRDFEMQGVCFRGVAECKPCYWMNTAFGPGAEEALRGRGGLRARILTSGWLRKTG